MNDHNSLQHLSAQKLALGALFMGAVQNRIELTGLITFLRSIKLHTIVEIGTMKGGTFWLWCKLAEPNAVLISIDLPGGHFGGKHALVDMEQLRRYGTGEQQLHFLRDDSQKPATRERLVGLLNGCPIDLLFIDGDHRYECVRKDYELYAPLVRSGGFIVFHDILPRPFDKIPAQEVHKFWKEIARQQQHQEFIDHDSRTMGIGVIIQD